MSYTEDSVFQTIQQIRIPSAVEKAVADAWSKWSGKQPQSVRIKLGLTNYKPFERARVMAEATIAPGGSNQATITLNLFFQIFAKAETALKEAGNGYSQNFFPCNGPPIFLIPDWHTVVWTLPNAPNMRELAQLLDPEHFCNLLVPPDELKGMNEADYPTPKLFRYVPLKRSLLTWEHPTTHSRYFAKLINEDDAECVIRNFQIVDEVAKRDRLKFDVPQIVSYNPTIRTVLMTEVSGTQFTEIMRRALPETFAQVGEVLGQLHYLNLDPKPVWTPQKELKILSRHLKGAKLALPQLSSRIEGAIAKLKNLSKQFSFPQNQPIHGNLFGDQIHYNSNRIGIVDWDMLSAGDSLYDIGRLIAHLIYLAGREEISPSAVSACVEALLRSYEAETNRAIERSRLVWHIATQVLLRGKISSLRKLPEGWQTHLSFVVTECEKLLDGKSDYLSLPALKYGVLSEV
ncbi:phosphotransferase [Phormidium sp. LEGE 05292]|uniref:phosphotransferase n=1 Tax=[Phormidium] sp. LEGE 05292 TaxID=767427 RepID=UPI001880A4E5|nr:phosphotransferase [Phormidium sp. LEGE 05292]MBE9224502.1 phosphotransferase [Phormidium sp. LEGE 05292]